MATNTAGAKSIEKLSSGYRINRAGDDAAGLAISEKMRSQVRGLNQASRNAQDDISLVQTTEGALNETHAIIHRMREMAVQSANDTNTDEDRQALQNEMDQLAQEVTRIANNTEFNTRKLLNAVGDLTFHIGANTDQNMQFSVKAMDAKSLGLTEDITAANVSGSQTDGTNSVTIAGQQNSLLNGYTITFNNSGSAGSEAVAVSGKVITITGGDTSSVSQINGALSSANVSGNPDLEAAIQALSITQDAGTSTLATMSVGGPITLDGGAAAAQSAAATFNAQHGVATEAVVAKGINISTQVSANTAITRIDSALKAVSDQRAELGAVQNRLSHTIKNLDVSSENLQENNILQQASQAMLAQANQAPQGVLQLLR